MQIKGEIINIPTGTHEVKLSRVCLAPIDAQHVEWNYGNPTAKYWVRVYPMEVTLVYLKAEALDISGKVLASGFGVIGMYNMSDFTYNIHLDRTS